MKRRKKHFKARDMKVTESFLHGRYSRVKSGGYDKQKWVLFCEIFLHKGFDLWLYEARQSFSKYITIKYPQLPGLSFKVRFSNHPPIKEREDAGDCDFFVGRANNATTTTAQAIDAALSFFRQKWIEKNP